MARAILVFFERLLLAAVSVVIVVIVASLFVRALRGPEVIVTTVGPDDSPPAAAGPDVTEFVPVTFPEGPCAEDPPLPEDGLTVLFVYFTCGNSVLPTADSFVYRRVPETDSLLSATFNELLQGPSTREGILGFRSVFSVATAGSLESVRVDNAEAVIDFARLPTVVGIAAFDDVGFFVANLNANVFQFEDIGSVEYRLGGSCAAFWEHLGDQRGCRIIARENFESTMAANRAE